MLFNSINFLLFFLITITVYYIIPKNIKYIWLLIVSYYFYMSWNVKYSLLLLSSTLVTYFGAIGIEKVAQIKFKKIILQSVIIINLALLFFFKYYNFAIETINFLLGKCNITKGLTGIDVLLPVGISFYIFQALGYIIDVYRGDVECERNVLRYMLFVSFFPQLVAGPIERSKNLLFQLRNLDEIGGFDFDRVSKGVVTILWGLFIKMVIADRVGVLVDNIWDKYYLYGNVELIIAAIGFAIQIYGDFSGYSIVAVGCAEVIGIDLMNNFNAPYLALSIRDFWKRWHISLSSWFRDYLYIPLGGGHCSNLIKNRNIMITMLVSGLWHGANYTYIIWGGLHGIYQVIENVINARLSTKCRMQDCFSSRLLKRIVVFVFVDIAWIFFRSNSLNQAFDIIKIIFTKHDPWALFDGTLLGLGLGLAEWIILLGSMLILMIVDYIGYSNKKSVIELVMEQQVWFVIAVILFLVYSLLLFGEYGPGFDSEQFIYFQF